LDATLDRFDVLLNSNLNLRDMYHNTSSDIEYTCDHPVLREVGPKEGHVWVKDYAPGNAIKIDFRLYNDWDRTLNTYVYLDNVRLEFQDSSSYNTELPAPSGTPDGRTGR